MTMTTPDGTVLFGPDQVAELFVEPLLATAVSSNEFLTTIVPLDAPVWRAPKVTADPSASWVNEGQEIPLSDAELDQIVVEPRKLAGLTVVSSELLENTDDVAAAVIGDALVRDSVRKLDAAFVGNLALPGPPGLGSTTPQLVFPGELEDMSAFAIAAAAAENVGANITGWVCSSKTALALANLRTSEGSNEPLLALGGAAAPTLRVAEGRPIFVVPGIPDRIVWGLDATRNYTVVRTTDADVVADASAFFTSDRIAIRSRFRAGFGFIHEEGNVRIEFAPRTP